VTARVTVAIPTRNGAGVLEQTLAAVRGQKLEPSDSIELLACDSGSLDGTAALARSYGAEVIEIPPDCFSHGGTRNLLMERSQGAHVAFLTQDAVPADDRWLARLLDGFALRDDVGLVFGPYRPRPDASPMVARELTEWFRSFSPDGSPRIDWLDLCEREASTRSLFGRRAFFTDANGAVSRAAWQVVPFRAVAYAEDHVLALDMMRAGYAKAYVPEAAVIHSHDYSGWNWLRRSFDEYRALSEVYGFAPALRLREIALNLWGLIGADWRWSHARGRRLGPRESVALLVRSAHHHGMRSAGALLGARADRLPAAAVRTLSLEGRGNRART